jgi:hypothetical protein
MLHFVDYQIQLGENREGNSNAKKSATATTRKPRKSPAAKSAPTHEEIALRAYHIYLQRNGAPETLRRLVHRRTPTPRRIRQTEERRRSKVIAIAA